MIINKQKIKVSIILTVFNRNKLFFRALKSINNQTYKNYEVIIIDDGSTDYLEKKLFPILKEHNNYKYIRHSNRNVVLSLNTGILIAQGEYLTFLDSDDEYEKNHLNIRVKFLKKNKNIDLLYSNAKLIGNEKDFYVPDLKNKNKLIHLNKCIIGATFFGKKEVFIQLNGFRNMYSYDSDFLKRAKIIFNVKKIQSDTYLYYRNSKDSILTRIKNNEIKEWE